jgi:hypothetical protein
MAGGRDFDYHLNIIHIGSGTNPAWSPMDALGFCPHVKRPIWQADLCSNGSLRALQFALWGNILRHIYISTMMWQNRCRIREFRKRESVMEISRCQEDQWPSHTAYCVLCCWRKKFLFEPLHYIRSQELRPASCRQTSVLAGVEGL